MGRNNWTFYGEFVSYILETNVEKKALNILSTLRNLSTKHTNEELEKATQTLLEISTNPTISVLKGILDRREKTKSKRLIADNHQTIERPWIYPWC